jgi:hypothetical protein
MAARYVKVAFHIVVVTCLLAAAIGRQPAVFGRRGRASSATRGSWPRRARRSSRHREGPRSGRASNGRRPLHCAGQGGAQGRSSSRHRCARPISSKPRGRKRSSAWAMLARGAGLRNPPSRLSLRRSLRSAIDPRLETARARKRRSPEDGWVAEWSIAPHSKCGVRATVP